MKPTVSNAFNDGSSESSGSSARPADSWGRPNPQDSQPYSSPRGPRRNPRKSLAASLAPMQVDLRETSFGWPLDLSPIQAIDVLQALKLGDDTSIHFLVNMEQSAWRDGDRELTIAEIAQRVAIQPIATLSPDQLVLDQTSLLQLVSLCQPSRLVVVAVEGEIDARDAQAIEGAIAANRSPLLAEIRAVAAVEVLGDRSVVVHSRSKSLPLKLVADNFRHYLAALTNTPAAHFEAPEPWHIERLLSLNGMLTVRPIETQQFSTSIDVGVNTAKERFSKPADHSLIYDIPSNTWHDEP